MPGATPKLGLPYSLPADKLIDYPTTVSKPLADKLDALGVVQADTAWRVVGAAGQPPFQNGWVAYGSGQTPPMFRKLASGLVICEGMIKGGADNTAMWTMPVGYRPAAYTSRWPAMTDGPPSTGIACVLYMGADGTLQGQGTHSTWVILGGVQYLAEA